MVSNTEKMKLLPGPWDNEPNKLTFKAHGLKCFIQRQKNLGHLCGYVDLPNDHSAFGKHYDNIDVEVHGGLTYAQKTGFSLSPFNWGGKWRVGFDCAHLGDFVPAWLLPEMGISEFINSSTYRDIEYVKAECSRLAEQLSKMGDKKNV